MESRPTGPLSDRLLGVKNDETGLVLLYAARLMRNVRSDAVK